MVPLLCSAEVLELLSVVVPVSPLAFELLFKAVFFEEDRDLEVEDFREVPPVLEVEAEDFKELPDFRELELVRLLPPPVKVEPPFSREFPPVPVPPVLLVLPELLPSPLELSFSNPESSLLVFFRVLQSSFRNTAWVPVPLEMESMIGTNTCSGTYPSLNASLIRGKVTTSG